MSDISLPMLTRVLSLLEKDEHSNKYEPIVYKLLRKDGKMYNQICIGSLNTIIEYLNNKYDLSFKIEKSAKWNSSENWVPVVKKEKKETQTQTLTRLPRASKTIALQRIKEQS